MKLLHHGDVLYIKNLYYTQNNFHLEKKYPGFLGEESTDVAAADIGSMIIEEPVLIIETIDSCYSHALLDRIFPLFWAMDSIRSEYPSCTDFRLMIRGNMLHKFGYINLPMIDFESGLYNGFHRELQSWITPFPLLLPQPHAKYYFRHAFVYTDNDDFQYSIWNTPLIYPGRAIASSTPRFDDTAIYPMLFRFREHIMRRYGLQDLPVHEDDKILLIERKKNRIWDQEKIRSIPASPVLLEDMDLRQQIVLFATHRTVIFRHGSCLANLLFSPKGTRVFDLDHEKHRASIVGRLCRLTDSHHFYLDYHTCGHDWFTPFLK
jgi:hypothetical protein